MSKTIVIFTESYPFSLAKEGSFLEHEVQALSKCFEQVIICPRYVSSEVSHYDKSLGIIVDESYASMSRVQLSITKRLFTEFIELFKAFRTLDITAVKWFTRFIIEFSVLDKWFKNFCDKRKLNNSNVLFYSFWYMPVSAYLSYIKKATEVKVLTRVHGYDLYKERHRSGYIPFTEQSMPGFEQIFTVSEQGRSYLYENYSLYKTTVKCSYIGVQSGINFEMRKQKNLIVSCSYALPVKRLDLLIEGLKILGEKHRNRQFVWKHIGDGPLLDGLKRLSNEKLPDNIEVVFMGKVVTSDVYQIMKEASVIVNVSLSEGLPISSCEALESGLAVICTDVGGNAETVSNGNGFLLSAKPKGIEVSTALENILLNEGNVEVMGKKSRELWLSKFDASKNAAKFAEFLKTL